MKKFGMIKLGDAVVFAAVIFAAAAFFAARFLFPGGDTVNVTVDGREKAIMHLSQNGEVFVEGPAGGLTVKVENGRVFVTQAHCPDKLCQKMHSVGSGGGSIICLPNRCVVKVEREGGADAVTG